MMRTVARVRLVLVLAVAVLLSVTTATVTAAQGTPQARPVSAPSGAVDSAGGVGVQGVRIRAGALVRPETVTVGQPFTLVATVEVPMDATVQWPTIGDTASVVAMRSPVRVTSAAVGAVRRESAEYALAAWNIGTLPLGAPNITVRTSDSVHVVPLDMVRIVVLTVLPGDTSLHVPKPPRDLFPRVLPWWELWWPAAVVVAALALLWWLRRKWQRRVVRKVVAPLDVYARAQHDFDRLERLALADVGERGRAVALAIEVVRSYLAARIPDAALSRTSPELLVAVGDDPRIPHTALATLLHEGDQIKFARRDLTLAEARALHADARAVVDVVEQSEQERRARDDEERRAREKVAQTEKAQHEESARKASRRAKAGVS